jgi:hypothetical protein
MVVSLLNDDAGQFRFPKSITYLRCDVNTNVGRAILPGLVEIVEKTLRRGRTVVVHCRRGRHRTGAFCVLVMARAISSGDFPEARGPSHQAMPKPAYMWLFLT